MSASSLIYILNSRTSNLVSNFGIDLHEEIVHLNFSFHNKNDYLLLKCIKLKVADSLLFVNIQS